MVDTTRRGFLQAALGGAAVPLLVGAAGPAQADPPAADLVTVDHTDPRYAELVRANNYRFTGSPDYVRLASTSAQVERAVRDAVSAGKRIAVRSGGHCGEAFVANPAVKVVLDVSPMSAVAFDRERKAFMIEPGATLGQVYKTLYRGWGVTLPTGACTSVGIGGHVCGGGYGPLSRLFGLAVDHLHAVEVVLVDRAGRVSTVVASNDPDDPNRDLWWAHTGGGGGNFGVVTRYWLRTPGVSGTNPAQLLPRPPGALLTAAMTWSWDDLTENAFTGLMRNFMRWHVENSAPGSDALGLFAYLLCQHREAGAVTMVVQMDATAPDAEGKLAGFLAEVDPGVRKTVTRRDFPWLSASRYLGSADVGGAIGVRNKVKSAYLRSAYGDEQLGTIHRNLTAPGRGAVTPSLELIGYGGRINAVPPSATAVSARDSVMKVLIGAFWTDEDEDEARLQGIREFYTELHADTGGVPVPNTVTDGTYINYPDVDVADPRWNRSGVPWHALYYKDNYPRLQRAKSRWDPGDVFTHGLGVRPASG